MLVNAALKSNQVTHGGWGRSHSAFWDQNLHFISISDISTPLRDILCRIICLLKASILECWEFLRGREWNMKSAGVVLWEIYISNFSFQSKTFWQNMKIDLITMLNASTLHSIWSTLLPIVCIKDCLTLTMQYQLRKRLNTKHKLPLPYWRKCHM